MLTFDKSVRLRKRADYTTLAKNCKKLVLANFIILKAETEFSFSRLGVTVSRKVGNSVCRNRIKRLIREFFRSNKDLFTPADYNIIARSGAVNLVYIALCQELANGLCRIGQQNNH